MSPSAETSVKGRRALLYSFEVMSFISIIQSPFFFTDLEFDKKIVLVLIFISICKRLHCCAVCKVSNLPDNKCSKETKRETKIFCLFCTKNNTRTLHL